MHSQPRPARSMLRVKPGDGAMRRMPFAFSRRHRPLRNPVSPAAGARPGRKLIPAVLAAKLKDAGADAIGSRSSGAEQPSVVPKLALR
jgi:hypothetical protein